MSVTNILDIPQEITEHALVQAEPSDVASFAQTCRRARAIVYEQRDQHLWRRLFLEQPYDHPRRPGDPDCCNIDWKKAVQHRVYATRVIQKVDSHPPNLAVALSALVAVARNAPPMPVQLDESHDLRWLCNLTRQHNVFELSEDPAHEWTVEEQQNFAELWTYVGWRNSVLNQAGASLFELRTRARWFVYDMRRYARESFYGPFMPDWSKCINWLHVKYIITVMYCNLMDLSLWPDTRPPAQLDAVRANSAPNSRRRNPRDWAGVEGTWRRYVCFMDYRDLFTFNYATNSYDPAFFEDEEFQEATRLIELKLTITGIGEKGSASSSAASANGTSSADSPSSSSSSSIESVPTASTVVSDSVNLAEYYPTIRFFGRSRGGNGNESRIRGSVFMMPEGYIRWRFASIYDGQSQWHSEGVQIGGTKSAAGVVGTWTGARHEEGDPAGPFWLWKVDDNHPSHLHD